MASDPSSLRPMPLPPSQAAPDPVAAAPSTDEVPQCRLCWAEEDGEHLDQLVSPCSCSGSIGHIHLGCLFSWQQELHNQGQHANAARCELCQQPYSLPLGYRSVPGPSALQIQARATACALLRFFQATLGSPPTYDLFGHVLSLYICMHGARYVGAQGAIGFRRGFAWGAARAAPGSAAAAGRPPLAARVVPLLAAALPPVAGTAAGAVYGGVRALCGLRFLAVRLRITTETGMWLRRVATPRALRVAAAVVVGATAASILQAGHGAVVSKRRRGVVLEAAQLVGRPAVGRRS